MNEDHGIGRADRIWGRIVLTVLGGVAVIVGSFLPWVADGTGAEVAGRLGIEIPSRALWSTQYHHTEQPAALLSSAGFVTFVLGAVAIVGLVLRSGILTRLTGALGAASAGLFVVGLYRLPDVSASIADAGVGIWLLVVGGALAFAGSFLGRSR